jgi:hypothetical protein
MCGFRFSPGEGSESVFFDAVSGVFPASVAEGVSVPGGVDAGGVEPADGWSGVAVPDAGVLDEGVVLVADGVVAAGFVVVGAGAAAGLVDAGVVAAGAVVGVCCAYRQEDSAIMATILTLVEVDEAKRIGRFSGTSAGFALARRTQRYTCYDVSMRLFVSNRDIRCAGWRHHQNGVHKRNDPNPQPDFSWPP